MNDSDWRALSILADVAFEHVKRTRKAWRLTQDSRVASDQYKARMDKQYNDAQFALEWIRERVDEAKQSNPS